MKTKYIKVSVSDRLPVANMSVILIDRFNNSFEGYISDNKNWIIYTEGDFYRVEYWLEEKPDYEEEMKEMLEEAIQYLTQCDWRSNMVETYGNFVMNAQEVLSKIK